MFAWGAFGRNQLSGPARRRSAFSTLELLVVLGVVAILLTLLLPALHRSMRQAGSTVCLHNLSEINHALQMYRLDNRGWLPNVRPMATSAARDPDTAWFSRLMPRYFAEPGVLLCPADPFRRLARAGLPPTAAPDFANASSYGMSDFILGSPNGFLGNLDRHQPQQPLATLLLADIGPDSQVLALGGPSSGAAPPLAMIRDGGHLNLDDGYRPGAPTRKAPWITARHSGFVHMLTVGGSVVVVRTDRLMTAPVQSFYSNCAAAGCAVCRDLHLPHYSFAPSGVYWWTGPRPQP